MSLGGADLNLLLPLKVLLEEVNVTRAGQRLDLSQPAMSAALARLRRRFDDELLTKAGRYYELTPFAVELLPAVQHAVRLMGRALAVEDGFDPATSRRTFRLTMSDYAIVVVHEPLLSRVSELAPGVRLRIDHLGPDARSSEHILVEYDALIGPRGFGFPGEARPMWVDRMVCLVDRRHHDFGSAALGLDDLARLPHAVAAFGPGTLTPVDRVFSELDITRRIQVRVAGWLPLPFVIEGTDMVAVVPERLARLHVTSGGHLQQLEPAFGRVLLAEGYRFSRDRLADPAHQWLFAILDEVGRALTSNDP